MMKIFSKYKNLIVIVISLICAGAFSVTSYQLVEKDIVVYAMFKEHTLQYGQYLQVDKANEIVNLNNQVNKVASLFKGSLEGYAHYFYEKCEELELPFDLALAITLHESAYGTSNLAMTQYNFGGIRGNEGWASFESPQAGIDFYLNLLKKGYFDKGATTPETIQPIYCPGSDAWVGQIYHYMDKINQLLNE